MLERPVGLAEIFQICIVMEIRLVGLDTDILKYRYKLSRFLWHSNGNMQKRFVQLFESGRVLKLSNGLVNLNHCKLK